MKGLTMLAAALLVAVATYADCTVTTDCNTYTFSDQSSVSTSAESAAGGYLLTVRGNDGQILVQETCSSGSISSSCSSSSSSSDEGSFDFEFPTYESAFDFFDFSEFFDW
ncbi:MAG: hypothetical protein ABJF04_12635 [Reichenbachiella sp.]|uniref:hypothetical protein n=1 Tax=Reichenbachiella sp. TaxID=2184521 RepID=UPI003263F3B6